MRHREVLTVALVVALAACNAVTGVDDLTTEGTISPKRTDTDRDSTEPETTKSAPGHPLAEAGAPPGNASVVDAAVDGASPPDVTPGSVKCGAPTCAIPSTDCCFDGNAGSCISPKASCMGLRASCDQRADCPDAGDVCCFATSDGEATCRSRSDCSSRPAFELCAHDSDCAPGRACSAHLQPFDYRACN